MVIDKVSGVLPGNNSTTATYPLTVTVRNISGSAYPAGQTIHIRYQETRPVPQGYWTGQTFTPTSDIPVGGTYDFAFTTNWTPGNSRPGPIELTFQIDATQTAEGSTLNNQISIMPHFYDPTTTSGFAINEDFNTDWTGTWLNGGAGTLWDTNKLAPQYNLGVVPPTAPIGHSEPNVATDSKNGALYLSSSNTWFRYVPAISLASSLNPFLTWSEKFSTEAGLDFCYPQISTDGGTSWTSLLVAGRSGTNPSWPNWDTTRVDLSSYIGQSNVRIRFLLTSDATNNFDGWYVDDVILGDAVTTSPGGFNLLTPTNGQAGQPLLTPFTWGPLSAATSCTLYVGTGPGTPPTGVVQKIDLGNVNGYTLVTPLYQQHSILLERPRGQCLRRNLGSTTPSASRPFRIRRPALPRRPGQRHHRQLHMELHRRRAGQFGHLLRNRRPARIGKTTGATYTFTRPTALYSTTYNWYVVAWYSGFSAPATQVSFTTVPNTPTGLDPTGPGIGVTGDFTWSYDGGAPDSSVIFYGIGVPARIGKTTGATYTFTAPDSRCIARPTTGTWWRGSAVPQPRPRRSASRPFRTRRPPLTPPARARRHRRLHVEL